MNADRDRSEAPSVWHPDTPEFHALVEEEEVKLAAREDAERVGLGDYLTELLNENENLRTTVKMDLIYQRRLEARLARVEALRDEWAGGAEPVHHRGYVADLDRALADPS